MVAAIKIDAADFIRRAEQFAALPAKIQSQVLSRGFRATARATEARVVRSVAQGTNLRHKDVRRVTRTVHSADGVEIVLRSGYFRLKDLGAARQTRVGVTVRGWGLHRSAFIIRRYGGHIYARVGKYDRNDPLSAWSSAQARSIGNWSAKQTRKGKDGVQVAGRFPIKPLWGPNPAAYVVKHAGDFQTILNEEAERRLMPEIARQLDLLLRL